MEGDFVGVGPRRQVLLRDNGECGLLAGIQPVGAGFDGGDGKVVGSLHAVQAHITGALVFDGNREFLCLGVLLAVPLFQLAHVLTGRIGGNGIALFRHLGIDGDGEGSGISPYSAVLIIAADLYTPAVFPRSLDAG